MLEDSRGYKYMDERLIPSTKPPTKVGTDARVSIGIGAYERWGREDLIWPYVSSVAMRVNN